VTAVWTLVLVAVLALVYLGMWRGWQHRVRRTQAALPHLPEVPAAAQRGSVVVVAEGIYVSTTTEGRWLDRVAAHGLGSRATGSLTVHRAGLLYDRAGAATLWVPRADVVAARDERAQAGKVRRKGGIVLVTWQRGPARFDTGFVPRYATDRPRLLAAIAALTEETLC
jgi:hypothetical protein